MRGRRSTGKVKLRIANGVLMFTIPQSIASQINPFLLDDTFECTFERADRGAPQLHNNPHDVIKFTRVKTTQKLRLRLR